MRLKDKVAIVTGGAVGIGRATAELFAEEGAQVLLADQDAREGHGAVESIQRNGGSAVFLHADISKEEDAKRISEEAVRAFHRIDILVNNAAVFVLKGIEASFEDWERSLHVNIIGTAMCSKYAVEHMKGRGGAIVNLSSISAFIAQPHFAAYSTTKAAVAQMTRNMAMDLAPYNIRVNSVCPGAILTAASYRHMRQTGISEQQFLDEVKATNFLRRIGQPREVAYAILFLASDEASYITGASLLVDGGYTAQ